MLTKEQIADCGWTHGDHCECERCDRRLAALKAAVVESAMDRHRIETGTCHGWLDEADVLQRYNAACAALAKAEEE